MAPNLIKMSTRNTHSQKFSHLLVGRKIVACRYLSTDEMNSFGWYSNPLVLILDDATHIIFQSDDEGNDGGAAMILNMNQNIETIAYTI